MQMEMDKIHKIGGGEEQRLKLPRVTIQFCTQCRWMLRAAYFAQELLSTFGTDIGEVALQPSTGGTFVVELLTDANATGKEGSGKESTDAENGVKILKHILWDRKSEGGFPETKELKKRLRNIIDPSRDLGHVDGKKSTTSSTTPTSTTASTATATPINQPPIPKAISILQSDSQSQNTSGERKFTPMDIDTFTRSTPKDPSTPQPARTGDKPEEEEKLNERGKIVITGLEGEGGFGVCRPDDEECGGF